MAVSLGFGIIFATLITLLLVPCLYLVVEDITRLFRADQLSDQPVA
jgi:Co/Zn/Cd efflux system component